MSHDEDRDPDGREELNAVLRKYGGLEGLARLIGQTDPLAYRYEPRVNDNPPRHNAPGTLQRFWKRFSRLLEFVSQHRSYSSLDTRNRSRSANSLEDLDNLRARFGLPGNSREAKRRKAR